MHDLVLLLMDSGGDLRFERYFVDAQVLLQHAYAPINVNPLLPSHLPGFKTPLLGNLTHVKSRPYSYLVAFYSNTRGPDRAEKTDSDKSGLISNSNN